MSLYQEVYQGESFTEEDFYNAARYVYQPQIGESTAEEIDDFLIGKVSTMTPEQAEGFWSSLGNVAKKVGSGALKVVSKAAPIVGTAVGTLYGVPSLGGMVGGLAGNLAGAGATALDKMPNFQDKPVRRVPRRRKPNRRKPYTRDLNRTWNQTKRTLGRVGKHALHAANDYAAQHPVQPYRRGSNESVLTEFFNDPVFEAALIRNGFSEGLPGQLTENDYDFINKVEAVYYLTEGILTEYYENDLLNDEEYFVDEYGELVANYPEDRISRIESYIESF